MESKLFSFKRFSQLLTFVFIISVLIIAAHEIYGITLKEIQGMLLIGLVITLLIMFYLSTKINRIKKPNKNQRDDLVKEHLKREKMKSELKKLVVEADKNEK